MTFTFEPARSLLIVAAVLLVAAVLSLLVSRKNPARKALGIVIVLVIVGVLLLRYRTAELIVDDSGISADTYGDPQIAWSEILDATYVEPLSASRYLARPTIRSSFRLIGYAKARYGWFDFGESQPALYAVQAYDEGAVVIETGETIYVFGPADPRALALAIAEHVPVNGLD